MKVTALRLRTLCCSVLCLFSWPLASAVAEGGSASQSDAATVAPVPVHDAQSASGEAESSQAASTALPRVLSINMCADQMVMLLADPSQIVALSPLSQESAGSYLHELAQAYPQARPSAEDILPREPDLVLSGPYPPRYTVAMLDELGIAHESLSIANSVSAMLGNLARVGELLQQEEKAARIIEQLELRLGQIADTVKALDEALVLSDGRRPSAAVYDANGYTVGPESMRGEAMDLAGWHNVATEQGIETYGVLQLESLIHLRPDVLIESPYSAGTYSRGQMLTKHPSLRKAGLNPQLISIPSNQTICAGPWSVGVIERLVAERSAL